VEGVNLHTNIWNTIYGWEIYGAFLADAASDARGASNLKAWATLDPTNGNTSVTVINKDEEASGTVELIVPGYTPGVVTRLLAPSFSAGNGVTWVGQTFNGS
jgi:hypothetical protein